MNSNAEKNSKVSSETEKLIKTLRHEKDKDIRLSAAKALLEAGDPNTVDALVEALHDDYWLIVDYVAQALVKIGKPSIEPLIALLSNTKVRRAVIVILVEIGDKQTIEPLIQALNDEDKEIRKAATAAMAKIGDERAVLPLISLLTDGFWVVRMNAAKALGELGDTRAIQPLIATLNDRDEYVRQAVAGALEKLGYKD